ncbi:MAG: toll/interleukin-1 receptor domain-containing protein [Caldilineaceae bacterium]|nr:toll/interleukin-1 receptor domain-containing protein [Caldilineaceae bacterium]
MDSDDYYDVFISHATEDKEEVARPLALALHKEGLRVWYDEFELKIGDSLRRKIDNGVARSRFGVVIISPSFFAKGWPQYELDGLVTKAVTGEQVLLPLWHNVTKTEVIEHSPSLADKMARSTQQFTIPKIATEIAEVIKGDLRGS